MNKEFLDEFEYQLKKNNISRREAIKLLGLGGAMFLASNEATGTKANASDVKAKIVIVGGGLAGISTAARLMNSLSNPDVTVIEPSSDSVSYQPGNTFIGAGLYEKKDVMYKLADFLPSGVKLIKDKAVEFNPENNELTISSGEKVTYDYLIVAAGVTLDFSKIKGLEEIGDAYTIESKKVMNDLFKNSGASTIYNMDGAVITWENMQKSIAEAKAGKKVKAVFSSKYSY